MRTVSSVRQLVASLSGGQRQTVAIAKAVLWNSRVVILDEPTAALGVAQTRQVLDLVRRLADQGLGVVLISHNMNEVMEVADRVVVLYLGRVRRGGRQKDTSTTQIVELITAGRSGDVGLFPQRKREPGDVMASESTDITSPQALRPPTDRAGSRRTSNTARSQARTPYLTATRAGHPGALPSALGLILLG